MVHVPTVNEIERIKMIKDNNQQKMTEIDLTKHNFVLTRIKDHKQWCGTVVKFIEWGPEGFGTKIHDEPKVGCSCIVDPTGFGNYTWLTTSIEEIISDSEFRTQNSIYSLHKV